MSDREYSARDKVTSQMTRDGLVENNVTQGTSERVSKRLSEYSFDKEAVHDETFRGHSRFTESQSAKTASSAKSQRGRSREQLRADMAAQSLEREAKRSEKQLERLEKQIAKQEKVVKARSAEAQTALPRLLLRRKEKYRRVMDAETGVEEKELFKYGGLRPRFERVIKKPANRFTLGEHIARASEIQGARLRERAVFEGEGSENVGLRAVHNLYRGYRLVHWYVHRKDYLKSERHRKYRAYVENNERLKGLNDARHKLLYETTVNNRHMANIAKMGEKEANKQLDEAQKKRLRHEEQKRALKKKYQKAKYAEQHGTGSKVSFADFLKKKSRQKRAAKETKEVASMLSSVLGSTLSIILLVAIGFFALAVFMFMCAGYAGTTDTDVGNITECDSYFSEWETDLREEILNIEDNRDDFDEYRYFVNGSSVSGADKMISYIGHDSIILSSFLAVSNNSYEMSNSAEIMNVVFNEMYVLEYQEVTEIRTDASGNDYEVKILEIYLTVRKLDDVVKEHMNENQKEQWEFLNHTGGNQQIFSNPFEFNWTDDISSNYGWRIHPISGDRKFHNGVDIAEPQGTEIHSCSTGTVITAKYSNSAGNYVVVQDKDGFKITYMHCHELYVSKGEEVERGDVIASVGTTGNSTGNHLHLQVEDSAGNTLNPLFVVKY